MSKTHRFLIILAVLMAMRFVGFVPAARADEWNRKTVFSINQPLRVPGNVVLPPGTYVLKRVDQINPSVIQITDASERTVYSTFFGIPDYLRTPAEQPLLELSESPAGTPRALKGWRYPGSAVGTEFFAQSTQPKTSVSNTNVGQ
jgi:hypothetical protein